MIPIVDAPAVPLHSDVESARPIQVIVVVYELEIGAESLTANALTVGRADLGQLWHPIPIPLSEESADPVSEIREVPSQAEVDEFDLERPLIPRGVVRLRAVKGEWPAPEWEF